MDEQIMACRHLAQFFQIAIEYNMNEVDFTIKALCSEYKEGIEIYKPQWYSQSQYYYFEEFMEENIVESKIYNDEEIEYEKERMYWLGYCLQTWSNKTLKSGKEISTILGTKGIEHLLQNYKIYHTVDPMYVLEDSEEYLEIVIQGDSSSVTLL
ncbi:DUF3791 domain-containing protein [Clostridium gasigenes]|uniref:DUF3791 domain-containing protein n=1 Tax=Clostridium gasigenes TaxID=94869 RepID=UPI001C0E53A8|nr:DUF3791 domain-containing protein [Clostridium gasigenes]MBU3107673.1 DUF3791 domain-containing protein [Clostridium gasigenes]